MWGRGGGEQVVGCSDWPTRSSGEEHKRGEGGSGGAGRRELGSWWVAGGGLKVLAREHRGIGSLWDTGIGRKMLGRWKQVCSCIYPR